MFKKYFFIVNPVAGKGKKLSILSELESFCKKNRLNFAIAVTKDSKEAVDLSIKAARSYQVVVAVGGDGTVNEVASGLVGTEAVLGILPIGSGNDFAKQVGYVKNLKNDLSILLNGRVKNIDVGEVNSRFYFINGLGIGFDGEVARRVRKYFNISAGFLGYLLSALRTLVTYQYPKVKIILDNHYVLKQKMLLTAVCNGTTYGGGFRVAPSAKLDDGFFTVCLADEMGRFYALKNIPRFMRGSHIALPVVHMFTAKNVIIESEKDLTAHIDGEILPLNNRFEAQVLPKHLKIIIA